MDDTTESGEQKLKAGGGKTLSLKRTVDSGPARQSLASGRTKSVVVEKKRKRTFKPGETPQTAGAPAVEEPQAPVAEAPKPVAAPVAPAPEAVQAPVEVKAPEPAPEVEVRPEPVAEPVPAPEPVKAAAPAPEAPVAAPRAEAPRVEVKRPAGPGPVRTADPIRNAPPRGGQPAGGNRPGASAAASGRRDQRPQQGRPGDTGRPRSGVVLRTLTEEEKNARASALADSRIREVEERARAIEEAKRRAEEDVRRAKEREEAAIREAEEASRREAEEAARARAAATAKRRLEAGEGPEERPSGRAGAPSRPVGARPASGPRPAGGGFAANRNAPAPAAVINPDSEARKPITGAPLKARTAADEDDDRRRGVPARPAPARTAEPRRRGKLTVTKAFETDERQRSLASMRRRTERDRKRSHGVQEAPQKVVREVIIPETITIQELANRMAERAVDVIKLLMRQGLMLKITDVIDSDTAQLVAEELGHEVKRVAESDVEEGLIDKDDDLETKVPRAPVVTVMGHVDHGKTSLLDALRKTDVVAGEAGGITQHIGAYQVNMASGAKITFLDTPGHAAFTAMRARGARATDIVVLVVAADDGVMPQTVEAIVHAKAAGVPIIVAINKMDKPGADPTRVKSELLQHEVVLEDFGGDVLSVEISAKTRMGLEKLEELILLQAEVLDLRANPNRAAEGVIIEAKLDRGRGPVGTVLIQRGTLKVGDVIVAGTAWGRVRALINDRGETVLEAGPSVPVEVLGLSGAPEAGDVISVIDSESRAREITDYRQRVERDKRAGTGMRASLDQMLAQLQEVEKKIVPLVIKADVQGSAEAISQSLEKLGTSEVAARLLHVGVGAITESDVTLAIASNAPIIGFNVRANAQARDAARQAGIEIRYYSVIYDLVDDVKAAMSGLLTPELRETFLGNAEILEVFHISKIGKVAGCRVTEGVVRRGASVRLIRDGVVIHEGKLSTLKRFKDEVKEVNSGQECGMAFENYQDMRAGDTIECFTVEEIKRTLD
ncbi:MAG: translation initiation factor IF-2 [Parvibaculaceae bacterium]|nr:translation initiation factor IF-2 [Parvibaculaceae bacterium]